MGSVLPLSRGLRQGDSAPHSEPARVSWVQLLLVERITEVPGAEPGDFMQTRREGARVENLIL
jgi:hypothetical protein